MSKRNANPSKVIILLSIIIAIISIYMLFVVELPNKPIAGQGGLENNANIGGSFELVDQNGKKFNSNDLKGKLSLIYFGFTYCPDICPTSLQKIAKVMETLDKYQIKVQPIFITVDPQRDKLEVLKEYLGHFNSKIIGLTGSEQEIKQVADKFKVYYAKSEGTNMSGNNYMIDHSSFLYLMDSQFKYMKHFYLSTTAEEIIEFIRLNRK